MANTATSSLAVLLLFLLLLSPTSGFEWFGRKAEPGEDAQVNEIGSPPQPPPSIPPQAKTPKIDPVSTSKGQWKEGNQKNGGKMSPKDFRRGRIKETGQADLPMGQTVERKKSLEVVNASIFEGSAAEAAKNGLAAISSKVRTENFNLALLPSLSLAFSTLTLRPCSSKAD